MTTITERSRVVTWDDPIESWKAARDLGGIDVLRAIEGGDLPPPPWHDCSASRSTKSAKGW